MFNEISTSDYNKLLKFLYLEGYTESYKDAEDLIEEMTEDEFGELYEEVILKQKIIDHLLGEGYAETVEAAEEIFENMNEDWMNNILDEAKVRLDQRKRSAMGQRIGANLNRYNQLSNMLASPHAQERPDVADRVASRRDRAWKRTQDIRGALKAAQRKNNP
jgi:hypothetical protein